MPHVLFVCTANICRSPVAEGILRDRLASRGLSDWTVSSAGTWALETRGAAHHSIQILSESGIDISNHEARMIDHDILAEADVVLCMEAGHVEALRSEFPDQANKIHLLSELREKEYSIADPYGGPRRAYETMVGEITALIDEGLPQLLALGKG